MELVELKTTTLTMKNSLNGVNSRLNITEEITELESLAIETKLNYRGKNNKKVNSRAILGVLKCA